MALCQEKGIVVTAYSPLGSAGGPLLREEKVLKVAEKHGVAVGTVLLNYHSMWSLLRLNYVNTFVLIGVFSQPRHRCSSEIGHPVKS